MQNTERQKFEDNWKSAFDGAEITPPDRVWSSIELDLAGQESAAMKKRVVFYQRLAAATVLFALLSGVYAFYPRDDREQLVVKKEVKSSGQRAAGSEPRVEYSAKPINKSQVAGGKAQVATSNPQVDSSRLTTPDGETTTNDPVVAEAAPEEKTEEVVTSPLLQTAPQVATLEPEQTEERKEKKSNEGNLWLAFGGAAGNYTPNTPTAATPGASQFSFAGAGPTLDALNAANTKKPEPKVGTSYSIGVAVGKKFGRVVLQTGINMNKQQVEYTSNYDTRTTSNTSKAASMDYLAETSTALVYTNEYTVNSTMEIVSIPVQAGYMIIDRKLGWQVNAGVSSDFFLRNVLVDKSGQRERFTQSAGSDSPYRSVNWSGLANTELSYRIGTHYRLSVMPGVRYSFNSILKEPTDNGRPIIFDVGFRFKYIFE